MGFGFWCLAFDGFIVYAIGANEIGIGPLMLESRFGYTLESASYVAFLPYIAAMVTSMILGLIVDKIGRRT